MPIETAQPGITIGNSHLADEVIEIINQYLQSGAFTSRIIGDTPTDTNQLTPRKWVTLNGASSARPTSSIIGQRYYDTTINKPIWADGNHWRDATSSIVG